METYTVRFLPHERSIKVVKGESVIRAALEAGVHINASCGGEGVCGKCRVLVETGSVQGGLTKMVSPADRKKGYRLACKAAVTEDVVIRIPIESEMDTYALKQGAKSRCKARIAEPVLEMDAVNHHFQLPIEKRYLELPLPTSGDNMPDTTRLIKELSRQYDEHRLTWTTM